VCRLRVCARGTASPLLRNCQAVRRTQENWETDSGIERNDDKWPDNPLSPRILHGGAWDAKIREEIRIAGAVNVLSDPVVISAARGATVDSSGGEGEGSAWDPTRLER
jgi:hypothetical protein